MNEKECMQAFSLVIRSPLCRRLNLSLHDFWADESIFEKERTRKSTGPLFGRLNRWFSASKSATFCWLPFAKSQRRTQCITQHGPSLFYGFSFPGVLIYCHQQSIDRPRGLLLCVFFFFLRVCVSSKWSSLFLIAF